MALHVQPVDDETDAIAAVSAPCSTPYPLVAARDGLLDLPFLKAWKPAGATR